MGLAVCYQPAKRIQRHLLERRRVRHRVAHQPDTPVHSAETAALQAQVGGRVLPEQAAVADVAAEAGGAAVAGLGHGGALGAPAASAEVTWPARSEWPV